MEDKKETRTPKFVKEGKYGMFAASDGEKQIKIALAISGKPVARVEDVTDKDLENLLRISNTTQTLLLNEYFRRYPEENEKMKAFMAKGGVA